MTRLETDYFLGKNGNCKLLNRDRQTVSLSMNKVLKVLFYSIVENLGRQNVAFKKF